MRIRHGERWTDATASNLSEGGMLLRVSEEVPVASEVSVHCVLDGSTRMHATGQVVHRDDQRNEIGIAFAKLSDDAALDLRRDLERRLSPARAES